MTPHSLTIQSSISLDEIVQGAFMHATPSFLKGAQLTRVGRGRNSAKVVRPFARSSWEADVPLLSTNSGQVVRHVDFPEPSFLELF